MDGFTIIKFKFQKLILVIAMRKKSTYLAAYRELVVGGNKQ